MKRIRYRSLSVGLISGLAFSIVSAPAFAQLSLRVSSPTTMGVQVLLTVNGGGGFSNAFASQTPTIARLGDGPTGSLATATLDDEEGAVRTLDFSFDLTADNVDSTISTFYRTNIGDQVGGITFTIEDAGQRPVGTPVTLILDTTLTSNVDAAELNVVLGVDGPDGYSPNYSFPFYNYKVGDSFTYWPQLGRGGAPGEVKALLHQTLTVQPQQGGDLPDVPEPGLLPFVAAVLGTGGAFAARKKRNGKDDQN